MIFIPRLLRTSLADAPELRQIQLNLVRIMAGFEAYYLADDTAIVGSGHRFYFVDSTNSPVIRLPSNPGELVAGKIDHLLIFNTNGSNGLAQIDPGYELINGVNRVINVPPKRRVEMIWLGGSIGWITDSQYTNAAIGMQVYTLQARENNVFGGNPVPITISHLERITDGNPGTATSEFDTVQSLSAVSFYLDFGSQQNFRNMNLIGTMRNSFQPDNEPVQVLLWHSNDLIDFNDVAHVIPLSEMDAYPFSLNRVGEMISRYFGVTIWHTDRWPVKFQLQELEIY